MRLSGRAMVDGNIVVLASTANHGSTKFLRVVAMDFAHLSPAWPVGLDTNLRKPWLLGQDRMRDCEAGGKSAWLFQIDCKTENHATVHIDDDGQSRSLYGLPVLLVDHDHVHGRWSIWATASGASAPGKWPRIGSYFRAAAFMLFRLSNFRRSDSMAIRRRTVLELGLSTLAWKHCSSTSSITAVTG